MMKNQQPAPQPETHIVIRSRVIAAFLGIHLQQRPTPVRSNNRTCWKFNTAMTFSQIKSLYGVSPALPFLELHADLGADIKQ